MGANAFGTYNIVLVIWSYLFNNRCFIMVRVWSYGTLAMVWLKFHICLLFLA